MDTTIIKTDGAGSGTCEDCKGRLDFSWWVTLSDGKSLKLCSTCLAQRKREGQ